MRLNPEQIKRRAERELFVEAFREAVEKKKVELKTKKSLWDKIFPYKILIIKKGNSDVRR